MIALSVVFGWCEFLLMNFLPSAVGFMKSLVTKQIYIFDSYAMINILEFHVAHLFGCASLSKHCFKPLLANAKVGACQTCS